MGNNTHPQGSREPSRRPCLAHMALQKWQAVLSRKITTPRGKKELIRDRRHNLSMPSRVDLDSISRNPFARTAGRHACGRQASPKGRSINAQMEGVYESSPRGLGLNPSSAITSCVGLWHNFPLAEPRCAHLLNGTILTTESKNTYKGPISGPGTKVCSTEVTPFPSPTGQHVRKQQISPDLFQEITERFSALESPGQLLKLHPRPTDQDL